MRTLLKMLLVIPITTVSCTSSRLPVKDDGKIDITFIQMNDVYEIAPLEGGKSGGMARVAHFKKEMKKANPNTLLIMAGDFLSPSVFNSLKVNGERVRGRQMVDVMNAAGTDIAVFGNHEFDISEQEVQSRINESSFDWVSTNTFHNRQGTIGHFRKFRDGNTELLPEMIIRTFRDADGSEAKIGFIGITLPFNKAPYVSYTDPLSGAVKMYERLKDSCDAIVAITHQLVQDDSILAARLPGLALIMGGHEHDMRHLNVSGVEITKAHANLKSVFVNTLSINKEGRMVSTKLVEINDKVPFDPATQQKVEYWTKIAADNFKGLGFNASRIVTKSLDALDGREAEIRSRPTNFTKYIVKAMEAAAPQSDVAIVNSGSIRVDDILYMPVTEYDIIRSLPFGGGIVEVDMEGGLLKRILNSSEGNRGIGGYLHYSGKIQKGKEIENEWLINGNPIENKKIYRVAMTDFLITGGEANMEYLKKDNPSILKVYPVVADMADPRSDIRLAIIRYMEKL